MSDRFKGNRIAIFYQKRNQVEQYENSYTIGKNDIQNYNKSQQIGAGHINRKTQRVKEMWRVHVKPAWMIQKYVVAHNTASQHKMASKSRETNTA
jgi:hypothetical protein